MAPKRYVFINRNRRRERDEDGDDEPNDNYNDFAYDDDDNSDDDGFFDEQPPDMMMMMPPNRAARVPVHAPRQPNARGARGNNRQPVLAPPRLNWWELPWNEYQAYLLVAARLPWLRQPGGTISSGNGQRLRAMRWMITVRLNPDQLAYVIPDPMPRSRFLPVQITFLTGQRELGVNGDERFGDHGHYQLYLETDPARGAQLDWTHIFYAFGWGLPSSVIQAGQVWMQPAYATPNQCIAYANKEETRDHRYPQPVIFGQTNPDRIGNVAEARENIVDDINRGAQWPELVARYGHAVLRYTAGYQRLISEVEKRNEPPPSTKFVVCLYGANNRGKTTKVYELGGEHGKVYKKGKCEFWEGYKPWEHEIVLFDEFRGRTSLDFDEFRKVVDRQAYPINVKCSFYWMRAKALFFCSNRPPSTWYLLDDEEEAGSFWRRFTGGVYEYMTDGTIVPRKLALPEFNDRVVELFGRNDLSLDKPFTDETSAFFKEKKSQVAPSVVI